MPPREALTRDGSETRNWPWRLHSSMCKVGDGTSSGVGWVYQSHTCNLPPHNLPIPPTDESYVG